VYKSLSALFPIILQNKNNNVEILLPREL
jgi:hypothetical protein